MLLYVTRSAAGALLVASPAARCYPMCVCGGLCILVAAGAFGGGAFGAAAAAKEIGEAGIAVATKTEPGDTPGGDTKSQVEAGDGVGADDMWGSSMLPWTQKHTSRLKTKRAHDQGRGRRRGETALMKVVQDKDGAYEVQES